MTLTNARQLETFKSGECDVLMLLKEPGLSLRLEQLQPGHAEMKHTHHKASQFFYVMEGRAYVEMGAENIALEKSQGLSIPPNTPHRIINQDNSTLKFLVVTQPEAAEEKY